MQKVPFSAGRFIKINYSYTDGGQANFSRDIHYLYSHPHEKITRLSIEDQNVQGFDQELANLFCEYLQINKTVEDMNLSNCRSVLPFLSNLIDAIIENRHTKIKVLSFAGIGLSDESCHGVARLIRNNTSIIMLNLNDNIFSQIGLDLITEAFDKYNFFMEDIFTFGNPNLDFAIMTIYSAIARNKNNNKLKHIFADELDNNTNCRWGRSKLMVIGQGIRVFLLSNTS